MKAKIRGIYTTALTKVLLENGFGIVHPSLTIRKRFGIPDDSAPPDMRVEDRFDLQGIRVLGALDAVNAFQSVLQASFEDVLTRKWDVSVDGIYYGKVIESDEYMAYVDLGSGIIGRLPKSEFTTVQDKRLLVQAERRRMGAEHPELTTKLKIVGDYAILAQNSRTGVSLDIQDIRKREELYALGKTVAPDGWGIIWRESSACESRKTLENEVASLAEKINLLNRKAIDPEVPTLLIEGLYFMDVEFPFSSKTSLDRLRASVAPTLDGHHIYRSCGGSISAAVGMGEKLLEGGKDEREIAEKFKEQIQHEFPEEGSLVDVEHVKLGGIVFHLGQAIIECIDNEQIKYSRIMRSDGYYDGLKVKKEAQDKAESDTKKGDWHVVTKYFSKDGKWKGTYINLNTPVEIYPNAIRYVDLEVDICLLPDGSVRVLDMEKLENALEKGVISKKLFEDAKERVSKIIQANTIQS